MPAIVMDPNNMTRDKLKTELQKFNIPLPPSGSRKDAYVELYKNKILNADRLEFSSDDDSISSTPKRNKKKLLTPKRGSSKKLSKKPSTKEEEMDVESLTDSQLAAKLRELGVDVGPILDSTRKVYRRKLQKLLDESASETAEEVVITQSEEIQEQEFSDNDETEVKEVYTSVAESYTAPSYTSPTLETYRRRTLRDSPAVVDKPSSRTSPRRPTSKTYLTDDVDSGFGSQRYADKENHFSREVTTRTLRSRGASDIVTQAKEEPEQKKKKGISIWVQLAIFAVVAIIIFLIIQNMEPANKSPIGKLGGSEV